MRTRSEARFSFLGDVWGVRWEGWGRRQNRGDSRIHSGVSIDVSRYKVYVRSGLAAGLVLVFSRELRLCGFCVFLSGKGVIPCAPSSTGSSFFFCVLTSISTAVVRTFRWGGFSHSLFDVFLLGNWSFSLPGTFFFVRPFVIWMKIEGVWWYKQYRK